MVVDNPFITVDVGSVLMVVFIIALWIGMIRALGNVAGRIALTILALYGLLMVMGLSNDVARIVVAIATRLANGLVAFWNALW